MFLVKYRPFLPYLQAGHRQRLKRANKRCRNGIHWVVVHTAQRIKDNVRCFSLHVSQVLHLAAGGMLHSSLFLWSEAQCVDITISMRLSRSLSLSPPCSTPLLSLYLSLHLLRTSVKSRKLFVELSLNCFPYIRWQSFASRHASEGSRPRRLFYPQHLWVASLFSRLGQEKVPVESHEPKAFRMSVNQCRLAYLHPLSWVD